MSNKSVQNTITTKEWLNYLHQVINDDIVDSVTNIEDDILDGRLFNLDRVSNTLDQYITQADVQDAIRALKNNKAPGPDGLCG